MGISISGSNKFGQIAANIKPACQKIVTNTTTQIRDIAASNAPVDTGFLQSSVYSVTPDGQSTYGQAGSPPGDSYLLPEEKPDNDTTGIVGVGANYGIYQEMGTRFMPAQPYFYPAVEAGRAIFEYEGARLEEYLAV